MHAVLNSEDANGRITKRDYWPSDPSIPGLKDSFFLYDLQDRVLCETTTSVSSCPTSGTNIKNSHSLSPPFSAAGDWKRVLRPVPGSTGLIHDFNNIPSTHQIESVNQSDGSPILGNTRIGHDPRGNRLYEDNANMTNDRRDYTYDGRRNVTKVVGKYYTGGTWHDYVVTSAFDGRGRRVFKSFYDYTTLKLASWYFYYDPLDRLTELRFTPDTSVATTYTVFQLFWLDDRLVLYWQTDYPSVTTSKRYVGTDESNRPIDMICWGTGNCPRVWSINPSAWGFDNNLIGPTVYQPVLFAGQYVDSETAAYHNDGLTLHRPGLALNWFRTYDPFTGSYLQVDPELDVSWSTYVYVDSDPVGKVDPSGRLTKVSWCVVTSTEVTSFELDENGEPMATSGIDITEQCSTSYESSGGGGQDTPTESVTDSPAPPGPTVPKPRRPRPKPIEPEREDCSVWTREECMECCQRNYDRVDVPKCQRRRTRSCWETIAVILGACIATCPRDDIDPKFRLLDNSGIIR